MTKLNKCITLSDLSNQLEVESFVLKFSMQKPIYRTFNIYKKNGDSRVIDSPGFELMLIQDRIAKLLNTIYATSLPDCVHGFVKSKKSNPARNIITNATAHLGKKFILNIDLKDFFHSINASMIREALVNLKEDKLNIEVASIIALLSTKNWQLPIGSPSSPVLSNLVFLQVDKTLMEYAKKFDLTYTRYADDLTFSSNSFIPEKVKEDIVEILSIAGFEINKKKVRFQSKQMAQYVTGIKVNEKLNVDRKYIRNIRAILHNWEQFGLASAANKYTRRKMLNNKEEYFKNSLSAKIRFVQIVKGHVNPISVQLRMKFIDLCHKPI